MRIIPHDHNRDPDLHHLQVFDVLLREHSLTRAAHELDVTQPALSKTLAQLRRYFDDPLFVRVALRMEPTPKALQLQGPVRAILERTASLRNEHLSFDPRTSHRTFNFCVVDAGLLKLLPPLVDRLLTEAPMSGFTSISSKGCISNAGSKPASSTLPWARSRQCPRESVVSRFG